MDKKPDKQTMKLLAKHIKFLKKFNPLKIVLFGSRAKGNHLLDSDIDLLVVSDEFENVNFRDRIIQAYGLWNKEQDLDIICLTTEELNRKKKHFGIIQDAIKEGIELK